MATNKRLEECRREVRAYLAERPSIALAPASIRRGLQEFDFSLKEVKNACAFLKDLGQLKDETEELGSSVYYQITAAGTLAHERSGS